MAAAIHASHFPALRFWIFRGGVGTATTSATSAATFIAAFFVQGKGLANCMDSQQSRRRSCFIARFCVFSRTQDDASDGE
jgi:hypothetical protein